MRVECKSMGPESGRFANTSSGRDARAEFCRREVVGGANYSEVTSMLLLKAEAEAEAEGCRENAKEACSFYSELYLWTRKARRVEKSSMESANGKS